MKRYRWAVLFLAVLAGALIFVRLDLGPVVSPGEEKSTSLQNPRPGLVTNPVEAGYAPIGVPATRPMPPVELADPAMRSPLADELLKAGNPPRTDLQIVMTLCNSFFEKCGGMPVGTNPEIVNALTGNNPLRLAFIARDHPAINPAGELVDTEGTPVFFHNVARDLISVRSAGPDREMFTKDDLVEESPRLRAER